MNSSMRNRRKELLKIAKGNDGFGPGKYSRKEVEKTLGKSKKTYNDARSNVESLESQISRLENDLERSKKTMQNARKDILMAHDILQTMDFSNASDVKLKKDDDISYAIDKKWYHIDKDDHSAIPYSDWKKNKDKPKDCDCEEEDCADCNEKMMADDAKPMPKMPGNDQPIPIEMPEPETSDIEGFEFTPKPL